jgi:hypothetical protein
LVTVATSECGGGEIVDPNSMAGNNTHLPVVVRGAL